ncbi:MAG: hypothetical protein EXX96DRAFT_482727 [Benjaminiella poitrasii]|nr:MAG: hypothetical protein EXX96DRAFT_482727 [Benjaminiella poitrasii]
MFSPHKPIIQEEDLATIKSYFDICIGSTSSEASPETKSEYEVLMKRQATLQNLKELGSDIMSWLLETPPKNSNTLGAKKKPKIRIISGLPQITLSNKKGISNYSMALEV